MHAGDPAAVRHQLREAACLELEKIAEAYESGMLDAVAHYAKGAVELADGNPEAALVSLRRSLQAFTRSPDRARSSRRPA